MTAKILIVDDEDNIRDAYKEFLADEGYHVVAVKDYAEFTKSVSEAIFDLIITDIMLGGKTGIDILRDVRAKRQVCPVVLMTGYPKVESAAEAVRFGAFDYITKPILREQLLEVTRRAIVHKTSQDAREQYYSNLASMFRSFQGTMIATDKDLNVLEINKRAEEECGFSRSMIGKSLASFTADCGSPCVEFLMKAIMERKGVDTSQLECKHKRHQDRVVTAMTYPLLDSNDSHVGGVMLIIDETVRCKAGRSPKWRAHFQNIIGKSAEMQKLYTLIETLASVQTNVLLTGESGTGKELVAEALHYAGNRAHKTLVKVNCAALPETLLESELFGHVKGAFTGAVQNQIGRFQKADGGTIFLDEIGDISPAMQARLLRVLQEMEFERVGDATPIKVNVRVIAATNKNLIEKVKRGEFREDLFYRLHVVELVLPPLRDRSEDIPLLIDHFIEKFNAKFGKNILSVTADALGLLRDYRWPGNVRELQHALEHAFIHCQQAVISTAHLPPALKNESVLPQSPHMPDRERQTILEALGKTSWNKTKAADLLGISRRTMYRKINEYNIIAVE